MRYCLKIAARIPLHRLLRLSVMLVAVRMHLDTYLLMKEELNVHFMPQIFSKLRDLLLSGVLYDLFMNCLRILNIFLSVASCRMGAPHVAL